MTVSVWPNLAGMAEVARGAVRLSLKADDLARARIAKALHLESLESLTAEATVSAWLDGAQVSARWQASATRICGVSLEPFETRYAGDFVVRLTPPGSPAAPIEAREVSLDLEADDPPDLLEGDQIDVGAYVVEHFALELDPFPRKPGVEFQPPEPEGPASPFAVLRKLSNDGSDL